MDTVTAARREIWKRPSDRQLAERQLVVLRRMACRFLIERGRPAKRSDVDDFLLSYWWRLDDDVHDLLDALARSRCRRGRDGARRIGR